LRFIRARRPQVQEVRIETYGTPFFEVIEKNFGARPVSDREYRARDCT